MSSTCDKSLAIIHSSQKCPPIGHRGDVVLDPFCGCGTAVDAAQKLKRKWIGIDITHLAISLIEKRLKDRYKGRAKFEVHGTPKDLAGARDLASRGPDGKYQFQWWAVSLVEAQPFQGKEKGADTGIDEVKFFRDLDRKEVRKIVVSVKGDGIKPDDVRALNHVREREKAEIAFFISLEQPTPAMVKNTASVGFYTSVAGKKFAREQLLTIDGLLNGTQRAEHPDYEPDLYFKKAKAETDAKQQSLILNCCRRRVGERKKGGELFKGVAKETIVVAAHAAPPRNIQP